MEADQKPTGSTNSSDGSVTYDMKACLPHSVPRISSITLRPDMKADKKPTGLIGRIIRVLQAKVSALKKKTAPVEDYGVDLKRSITPPPDMEADQKPTGSTNSSDGSVTYDNYNKEQSSEGHYKDLENQLEMEMLSDLFFERSFTSVSNDSNDGASWPYNYNKEQNSEDHYKDLENQQKMEREIYLDDPLFPERDVVRVDEQPTRPSSYELVRPDLGIKSMSSGMRKYEEEFRKKSEEFNELHPLR
ncbi:uncharacterized protein LOC130169631 [Seriola aureovittata]|uniref:uncharacterized protein LOC130169631 n=1 Tax=Seriola aureovittata TaxID=2871759 RepID=UPI0024BE2FA3|nr:uncharacterized protein LOC130169631 [Seriola aureovittata]